MIDDLVLCARAVEKTTSFQERWHTLFAESLKSFQALLSRFARTALSRCIKFPKCAIARPDPESTHFQGQHLIQCFALSMSLMAIPGCVVSVNGENHTQHHIVIGFGMVSTSEAPHNAVVLTDVTALGITLSDRPGLKFGIGYTASTVMTVAPGASDVRLEVSKPFGGPLTVNVPVAAMEEENERAHVQ